MTDRLMECITNPVKCKLLLEIHSQGKATAKQLADIYTDIPQATLYRHLKKMLSDGILQVSRILPLSEYQYQKRYDGIFSFPTISF